jgi:glycosyltransferase involved in cell wall biosynthesis
MTDRNQLMIVETHPVQYHAPVYRMLQQRFGIAVTAVYGSDFSVAGYRDPGFGATFSWDTDLLSGYDSRFLARVDAGGARVASEVSARGLGRVLREIRPRAVLMTGYWPLFHQSVFMRLLAARAPLLFRGETTDHARERTLLMRTMRDTALKLFYARCARLLYIGERSILHFRRLGCADEKLVYSPYCVDASVFQADEAARDRLRPGVRERLDIGPDQVAVLFAGKLIRHKAPLMLLRSVKQLPEAVRRRLVMVFLGSGELEREASQIADAPPRIAVRFLGFQNQSQLSAYYHAADLLTLPSRHWETWGLVVNEGLHHGLPCVVSESVGCALDLVEPGVTGEVFQTSSEEDCARALERAFALVGRAEVREQCRRKVSPFTIERAAAGIAEAYRAVAG